MLSFVSDFLGAEGGQILFNIAHTFAALHEKKLCSCVFSRSVLISFLMTLSLEKWIIVFEKVWKSLEFWIQNLWEPCTRLWFKKAMLTLTLAKICADLYHMYERYCNTIYTVPVPCKQVTQLKNSSVQKFVRTRLNGVKGPLRWGQVHCYIRLFHVTYYTACSRRIVCWSLYQSLSAACSLNGQ